MNLLKVALVGRPNVGKSTLCNRFFGKKTALVSSSPGMTRNVKEEIVNWMGLNFIIMDTPGLFDSSSILSSKMHEMSVKSLGDADLILFIIDSKEGITPFDLEIASIIRKLNKKTIIVVNKSESSESNVFELGLSFDVIHISALHGLGMAELVNALEKHVIESDVERKKAIKLSIMGRPNVGKSTLFNTILNEERSLVDNTVGVTRDSVVSKWSYKETDFDLIDTAGLLKKPKSEIDFMCKEDALLTLKYSEIVIFVINDQICDQVIGVQDLDLIRMIVNEGRPVVLAINLWKPLSVKSLKEIENIIENKVIKGLPWITISAKTGHNVLKLIDLVIDQYKLWNKRITTSKLNDWLKIQTETHAPPMHKGRRIKFKYMTQIKTRPPTFTIFSTKSDEVPNDYLKFLENRLRNDFGFNGIPLRFKIRSPKNPYAK